MLPVSTTFHRQPGGLRWAWIGALVAFIVAGATGVLFRFGVAYGATGSLNLTNVRHAHSHLMYFGWVTPAMMALIWHQLPDRVTALRRRAIGWVVGSVFLAAAIAYPLFFAFGYSPVAVGDGRMPLAVIGAGLNIFGWYGFLALYAVATRGVPRTRPLQLWDMALTFMGIATLGAWGLSLVKPLGLDDPLWMKALTHVFLDLFSEGWLVLGALGLIWSILGHSESEARSWSLRLIGAGLPFTFLLALPADSLSTGLKLVGCAGGAAVGLGLLMNVGQLIAHLPANQRWLWSFPLMLLGLKAIAQLSNSLVPGVWWASEHGLRVLYLHLMLLGFVSLALVAAARAIWGGITTRGAGLFYGAIAAVLLSLLPLTSWWPMGWQGAWAYQTAAWIALLPVVGAAWMAGAALRKQLRALVPA